MSDVAIIPHIEKAKLTPWLYVEGDDRLGCWLRFSGFLFRVSGKTLLTDAGSLGILLLVIAAKQVNLLLLLTLGLLLGSLGGIDGGLNGLGTVGGVVL